MDDEELTRHCVWVAGASHELAGRGYIFDPGVTPKDMSDYDQLLASRWQPQRKVIRKILERQSASEEVIAPFIRFAKRNETRTDE